MQQKNKRLAVQIFVKRHSARESEELGEYDESLIPRHQCYLRYVNSTAMKSDFMTHNKYVLRHSREPSTSMDKTSWMVHHSH